MINYCFGSREALLFEVFNRLQTAGREHDPEFDNIIESDISPKQKLIMLHFETMKMMLKYSKYVKAITKYVLLNRSISASRGSLPFIQAHFGERKTEMPPYSVRNIKHTRACHAALWRDKGSLRR